MDVISASGITATDATVEQPKSATASDLRDGGGPRPAGASRGSGSSLRCALVDGRFVPDPDGEWTVCTGSHFDPRTGRLRS